MRTLLLMCLCLTSGCVAIFRTERAEVLVETDPPGAKAVYRGQVVTTPGVLRLPRTEAGQIEIRKEGYQHTIVNFDASPDAGMWVASVLSNATHGYFTLGISFVFGMIVDIETGALNSFDGDIRVALRDLPPRFPVEPEPAPAPVPPPPPIADAPLPPSPVLAEPSDPLPEVKIEGPVAGTPASDAPRLPPPARLPLTRPERIAFDIYRAAEEAGRGTEEDLDRLLRWLRYAEDEGGAGLSDDALFDFGEFVMRKPAADHAARWETVRAYYAGRDD